MKKIVRAICSVSTFPTSPPQKLINSHLRDSVLNMCFKHFINARVWENFVILYKVGWKFTPKFQGFYRPFHYSLSLNINRGPTKCWEVCQAWIKVTKHPTYNKPST